MQTMCLTAASKSKWKDGSLWSLYCRRLARVRVSKPYLLTLWLVITMSPHIHSLAYAIFTTSTWSHNMHSFITDTACKFQFDLNPSTLLSVYLPQQGNDGKLEETMQLAALAVCSADHCNSEQGYTNPRLKCVWWQLIFSAQLLFSLFLTYKILYW